MKKRPFIIFSAIDYQFLYQRPQHIASGLVKRGYDVYFRNVGQVSGREPVVIDGVNIYQDWDKRPAGIDDDAIFIIYHPAFSGYHLWNDRNFLIYDCVDDFPDFHQYQEQACNFSNLIVYTVNTIRDNLSKLVSNKHFLKLSNGTDVDLNCDREIADEMKNLKKRYNRIIGFLGAMHYTWVDIDLLYKIAKDNPRCAVVVVGNTYTWNFNNPKAPPNLKVLGIKPYKDIGSYYNGFDIGLIPFLDNQISQSADPIKMYEYASCGIPVVSKNLPFTNNVDEPVCYTYNTYTECISQIQKAINENNKDNIEKRKDFIKNHTWDQKVDKLLSTLNKLTRLEISD